MLKAFTLLATVGVLAGGLALGTSALGSEGKQVLGFGTMAPVTEPFTGAAHPVRGMPGGGLPWQLDRARGELRADGRLKLRVDGLVLARRAPVPAAQQGTNPIPQFRAVVSCLTTAAPDTGQSAASAPVPASPAGDASFDVKLALPSPCIAPIVFVTSPGEAWFAATGR
jgi:hypothetical protein